MKTTFEYTSYCNYEQLTHHLKQLAQDFSAVAKLESICTTPLGRDVWVLTITDYAAGNPLAKPAFYIDGNTHAGEVTGSMAALHTADVLCTNNTDPQVAKLLTDYTFYVMPRISPDGAETYLETAKTLRSVDRPYPHPQKQPGVHAEDLDGDGVIRMMRIASPYGAWKASAADAQLLEKRQPDDRDGTFYHVFPEGVIELPQGEQLQPAPVYWGLDFNRNYPYGWFNEARQSGAGAYPLSNAENRAVVDFVLNHPNIGAVATHHTTGGVILYPPGTVPEKKACSPDMKRFREIGAMGTAATGYPAVNIFDHFMIDQENYSSGAFDDWCYQTLGIPAYTVELWNAMDRAGAKIDWLNLKEKTDSEAFEDFRKVVAWCQENAPGSWLSWTTVDHPHLGTVEIGGLDTKFTMQNCPPAFLTQEVEKTTQFMLRYAQTLPQLVIDKLECKELGSGFYEIKAVIANAGYLPTYLSEEALKQKTAKPVKVGCETTGSIVHNEAIQELGHLQGYSAMDSAYSHGAIRTGISEPSLKAIYWVIKADPGTMVKVTAFQEKSGCAAAEIIL